MICTYLLWENKVDEASLLTASTEVSNFPVDNIQNTVRQETWRTEDITSENVVIDMGTGVTLLPQSFCLSYHNLTSSAVVKLQANATDVWTSPSVNQTVSTSWVFNTDTAFVLDLGLSVAYRYWRVVIEDTNNTDDYLEIGRIYLGDFLEIDKGASESFSEDDKDTSNTDITISGAAYSDEGYTSRIYDIFFPWWESAKKLEIQTALRTVKSVTPVFMIIDINNTDKIPIIYGILKNKPKSFNYLINQNWSSSWTIEEVF
jgi:hypothetical protein